MATKKTTKSEERVIVPFKDVNRGDVIYLSEDDKDKWLVIDVGQPYILIENLSTNFASLYHVVSNLYKDK